LTHPCDLSVAASAVDTLSPLTDLMDIVFDDQVSYG